MTEGLYHILLVDDSEADAYLFRKALEEAGLPFELTVIQDGAEGLAFVRREGGYAKARLPNLAVLDLNLPKNDGIEILAAIRESPDLAQMPVIVATSSASPDERARTETFEVERFVTKPPDLEGFLQLGEVVKTLLRSAGDS